MICERCVEIGETLMTEGHGELCDACQPLVQAEAPRSPRRRQDQDESESSPE